LEENSRKLTVSSNAHQELSTVFVISIPGGMEFTLVLLVDAEPSAPATSPMEFRPTERPRALQQTKMVQLDSLDRGND
jgi:hypothetical protein